MKTALKLFLLTFFLYQCGTKETSTDDSKELASANDIDTLIHHHDKNGDLIRVDNSKFVGIKSHVAGHPPDNKIVGLDGIEAFQYVKEDETENIYFVSPGNSNPFSSGTRVKFTKVDYNIMTDELPNSPSRALPGMIVTLGIIEDQGGSDANGTIIDTPVRLSELSGIPEFNIIQARNQERHLAQDRAVSEIKITRKEITYKYVKKLEPESDSVYYHLRNVFLAPNNGVGDSIPIDLEMAIDLTYIHLHEHPNSRE